MRLPKEEYAKWAFMKPIMTLVLVGCWVCCVHAEPQPSRPRQVVSIDFEGVESISKVQLKGILDTVEKRFLQRPHAPLDENVLQNDIQRIEKFYHSQGFLSARVLSSEIIPVSGDDVRIVIRVEEGPEMKVSQISLLADGEDTGPLHDELLALLPLQPGSRFVTENYRDCESAILRCLADKGHPKAHIDQKARLDKVGNTADISITVESGPVCYFGPITIEGAKRVKEGVILRELTFRPGDRFDASKIQESRQRLFDLRLFSFTDLSVQNLEGEGRELPVHVVVREGKKQTVRFGAGYGTEEKFRGKVQWEIRNFLGDGRRLQLNAKASSLGQLVEGSLFQPYLMGAKSSLTTDGGWTHEEETSYENRKFYITPRVNYYWSEELVPYIGYGLEANRLLSVSAQTGLADSADREKEEYFVSSITGGFSWDHVDDPMNSTKGFRIMQNLEWASVALGSEVDYIKLSLEGRGFLPLAQFGVLGLRIKWGGIKELENTRKVPIFKRFFAGGGNSVRGYPYQRLGPLDEEGEPYGGLTLVEGNLDWRFPLPVWKMLEGVVFFDWGNVYTDSYHLLWDELRYTSGCGLRYQTPVGPLRVDFGYQLNPPDQDFFNRWQLHFSIGQAF